MTTTIMSSSCSFSIASIQPWNSTLSTPTRMKQQLQWRIIKPAMKPYQRKVFIFILFLNLTINPISLPSLIKSSYNYIYIELISCRTRVRGAYTFFYMTLTFVIHKSFKTIINLGFKLKTFNLKWSIIFYQKMRRY